MHGEQEPRASGRLQVAGPKYHCQARRPRASSRTRRRGGEVA
jgi:hypothetical protein